MDFTPLHVIVDSSAEFIDFYLVEGDQWIQDD